MLPKDFHNIIFDLGGVILNIDYRLTIQAFGKLGFTNFEDRYSQAVQSGLFDLYERGEISSAQFRNEIRRAFKSRVTDEAIDLAWNAMLLDLPISRISLLERISESKRIALLSNTNEIHIEAFGKQLNELGVSERFGGLFERIHYSFEVGMRKPEARIFEHVLARHGFLAAETLFIDDSVQHIEGARAVGINTYHLRVDRGETIEGLF